jgi:hypothetical protein
MNAFIPFTNDSSREPQTNGLRLAGQAFITKETAVKPRRDKGIALVTTLLILLLMSTMMIGLAWLVMGDQKLGGNNSDRQLAFYGAEAGIEQLTASLENAFDANYALNAAAVNALTTTPGPPTSIPGVQYLSPGSTTNGSGYQIHFALSTQNSALPASGFSTIPTGPYEGLVGLATPYTLDVTAHTTYGSEVRLQREVQTIGIPVFQFGMFSQTDLDFFAGPDFSFGGRVHSNNNIWLAEGNGSTLTMSDKVTAVGQIITSNLENGWPTSNNYNGAVDVTTGSGTANLMTQSPPQSATGTTNNITSVGAYNSAFGSTTAPVFNGNLAVAAMNTGVKVLNLSIATPAIGGQPIDLIRRPVPTEDTTNPSKLAERYYAQTSMRILLSDYGYDGTCGTSDISSTAPLATRLPQLSTNLTSPTNTPIDLATLAWDSGSSAASPVGTATTLPYTTAPSWLTSLSPNPVGLTVFPLPTSMPTTWTQTAYNTADGYWVAPGMPVITGCIKIDYQTTAGGAWVDITPTILEAGFTGRNIDPQVNKHNVPAWVAPPTQPSMINFNTQIYASGPTANTSVSTVGCNDPSPHAIIRLARLRDNPTTGKIGNNYCGNNPSLGTWSGGANKSTTQCTTAGDGTNCPSISGRDYWPNVLWDTREGTLRDNDLAINGNAPNGQITLAGAMYYVELDAANLAAWFTANSSVVNNTTGYSVYFSDRRGEQKDPSPPASVGTTSMLTGGVGYDDFVNPASANSCPNGILDQGEDVEGDFSNTNVDSNPQFRTYGNVLANLTNSATSNPSTLWPIYNNNAARTTITGTEMNGVVVTPAQQVYTIVNSVLAANPSCNSTGKMWPYAVVADPNDLRENPPIFFRRALKIVDGSTLSMGTCNSVPCGLTVVAENPVYLQGDYNNPGLNTGFTSTGVAASVVADAVTLLSDNWNDVNSFAFPYLDDSGNTGNADLRVSADTTYRLALAGGKNIPFVQPTVGTAGQDFGTDGGAHNFLRYLEDWGSGAPNGTLYFEGSIVSMYYNHQAVGTFKCCSTVYNPPTRAYQFDQNFLTPSLLPPLTPMLRLVNTIGYSQVILPTAQ